jgi:hypothetical protein
MKKKAFAAPVAGVIAHCVVCGEQTTGHFLYCPTHLDPASRPGKKPQIVPAPTPAVSRDDGKSVLGTFAARLRRT